MYERNIDRQIFEQFNGWGSCDHEVIILVFPLYSPNKITMNIDKLMNIPFWKFYLQATIQFYKVVDFKMLWDTFQGNPFFVFAKKAHLINYIITLQKKFSSNKSDRNS